MPGRGAGELAYERLSELIETCRLTPGWQFRNEAVEAAKLGMSRTPFREAMRRLGEEGLVVILPKLRTYVAPLDPDLVEQHMALRRAIEMEMITELAARPDRDLRPLAALVERQAAAVKRHDIREFLRTDQEFHLALVTATGNRPALETVRRSWRHINRVRYLGEPTEAHTRLTLAEHRAILKGLERGDAAGAAAALREHLGESMRRHLRRLQRQYPQAFMQGPPAEDPLREAGRQLAALRDETRRPA